MTDQRRTSALSLGLSPGYQRTVLLDRLVPGSVNRAKKVWTDVSGKAVNVAKVLAQLGYESRLACQSGRNDGEFRGKIAELGISLHSFPAESEYRTCTSLVGIDGVTEIVEPTNPITPNTLSTARSLVEELSTVCGVLVLSGSTAPGTPPEFMAEICEAAARGGLPTILDIRGAELKQALAHEVSIVKINREEFESTFGTAGPIDAAMKEISKGRAVIVTQGAGPVLACLNAMCAEIPVPEMNPGEVLNTTGSGDAFAAGLAAYILEKKIGKRQMTWQEFRDGLSWGIACAQSNARTYRPGLLESNLQLPTKRVPSLGR